MPVHTERRKIHREIETHTHRRETDRADGRVVSTRCYFICFFIIVLCCISLGPQPVGVHCPLTSSLGEFPGYWDWLRYPGLPPVLVPIAIFPFRFPFSVLFHSLFTCHWISLVFLLYDRRT